MKYIILLFLIPFAFGIQQDYSSNDGVEWQTDFNTALKKAKKQDKKILIYFTGSDWCGPCKLLKKDLFDTNEFQEIAKNYELLYIDIPRKKGVISTEQLKHNMDLMAQLNKRGVFPNLKVLNKEGKEMGALSGYNNDGNIQKHIKFLKKHIE
ncbi:thioredoxin family protein [Cellulophaga sp. F20128]|uniref:thioredoxin family protein n=1 Tax=Cellulophaga sp. F20128 TaxID=2926413 RepID=UPI001FF466C0|nr:thioredoxin family protein [Cellulophaga sp. F20128]MCK0156660.1 thioredoxin family protein [Cellulophaga sp. F20128]